MKEKEVIEELKVNPWKVFRTKRDHRVTLTATNGSIDLSKVTQAFIDEEWEEAKESSKENLYKRAKPILFNTEMVQAILAGKKTVTRRKIKMDLGLADADKNDSSYLMIPDDEGDYHKAEDYCRYQPGDILYVRETFCEIPYKYEHVHIEGGHMTMPKIAYRADSEVDYTGIWMPSIHMPKMVARIFLKVTGLRVERVQDIANEDIRKEGIASFGCTSHRLNFSTLWNEIYGDWEGNPYVWVIEFERVLPE